LFALVLGEVDGEKLVHKLFPFIDEDTLIIASSDLSHYLPYEEAVKKDRQTIQKIMDGKNSNLDACGRMPVSVLMRLAKMKKWSAKVLDYRNSGDTAADKERVVGYACLAFLE